MRLRSSSHGGPTHEDTDGEGRKSDWRRGNESGIDVQSLTRSWHNSGVMWQTPAGALGVVSNVSWLVNSYQCLVLLHLYLLDVWLLAKLLTRLFLIINQVKPYCQSFSWWTWTWCQQPGVSGSGFISLTCCCSVFDFDCHFKTQVVRTKQSLVGGLFLASTYTSTDNTVTETWDLNWSCCQNLWAYKTTFSTWSCLKRSVFMIYWHKLTCIICFH